MGKWFFYFCTFVLSAFYVFYSFVLLYFCTFVLCHCVNSWHSRVFFIFVLLYFLCFLRFLHFWIFLDFLDFFAFLYFCIFVLFCFLYFCTLSFGSTVHMNFHAKSEVSSSKN